MGLGDTLATYFEFEKHDTDLRTEIVAGVTTFLTMSYIVVVNPTLLAQAISLPNRTEAQTVDALTGNPTPPRPTDPV